MLYDSDTLYADDDDFENPINVGTLPQSFADYDATLTLTAIFAPGGSDLVIVTFEVNDITMGSVNPSGVQTYAVGTPFTVTATPFDGYRFVSWTTTIDGSTVTVEDAPSTFNDIATMDIDGAVIVANFEPVQGIDDVEADGFQAYSVDGKVVVKGVENMDVNVYDVTGRQIQAIKQSGNHRCTRRRRLYGQGRHRRQARRGDSISLFPQIFWPRGSGFPEPLVFSGVGVGLKFFLVNQKKKCTFAS